MSRERTRDLVTLLVLLILAGALRLHQYERIPYPNETADEYAYLWSGWTWLHEGAPTGWSWKYAYGSSPVYLWNESRYRLVTPWLDHPPLYALLVGGAASLTRAPELFDASLPAARLVSVALGTLAVALLFLLARPAYGWAAAALAGLLFATVPTIVLVSRLALAESLVVVLLLLALIAAREYGALTSALSRRETGLAVLPYPRGQGGIGGLGLTFAASLWLALALLASATAPLAKVPGVAVGVSVALFLYSNGRRRAAALAGLGSVAGLVPYVAYGAWTNWPLFRAVALEQAGRAAGLDVLPRLIVSNAVVSENWRDSWMAFLWLALAYATFRRDRLLPVVVGPYLVVLVAAVDRATLPGWYREPLFPGLCLAGGILLRDTLVRPDALRAALVLFGVTFGKLTEAFDAWYLLGRMPLGQRAYPLLVAGLAALVFAGVVWPGKLARHVSRLTAGAALLAALAASAAIVLRADELYPAYHPLSALEYDAKTGVGLVLTRYVVEPTTTPPGSWLRLWTSWYAGRDVGSVSLAAYVRPFDRRSGTYGNTIPVGEATTLASLAGEQSEVELTGLLPADAREGDYEVGVRVGDEPVGLGVVRVRGAATSGDGYQSVGRPTTFDSTIALDRVAIGQPRSTGAGTAYPLVLRVEPLRVLTVDYYVFVHVAGADDHLVAQSDGLPGGRRGEGWRLGEAVDDWRDLVLPPATPPGRYYLTAGFYEMASGRRLRTPAGDAVPLGVVEVGKPLAEEDVPQHLGARLAGGVELLGYGLETQKEVGKLGLTLYWRASGPIPRDYTVFAHLVDAAGKLRAQTDGPPDRGRVPTSTWRPGQVIADPREISLAGLPAGRYRILAGLYLAPDGPRLAVAGSADGAAEVACVDLP